MICLKLKHPNACVVSTVKGICYLCVFQRVALIRPLSQTLDSMLWTWLWLWATGMVRESYYSLFNATQVCAVKSFVFSPTGYGGTLIEVTDGNQRINCETSYHILDTTGFWTVM